jgi:eukaryotic-like serine/threonine-protein kinase
VREDGRLVAGRYRLQFPVGEGGMGVVWRAIDERLGREVAVKLLRVPAVLGARQTEQGRQRMLREARIAARLQHPNAVGIYDVTDGASGPMLVMEYLPSRSLAEVLAERGALPPQEVAGIGAAAAAALAAAHAAGIVHRDVKPGNVLLGHDGAIKITDFGISHAAGDVTLTSTGLLGTPAYLAPEVARGAPPGPAADVFSLGTTLYAAVEGTPPFGAGDNPIAQLHRAAAGGAPPSRHAGPLTPLLEQMLRDEPAGRPSMVQVAADLAELADRPASALAQDDTTAIAPAWRHGAGSLAPPTRMDGQPVLAPQRAGRPVSLVRRHPGYLIAGLAGCLLLGALLSVLLTGRNANTSAAPPRSTTRVPSASHSPTLIDPALLRQTVTGYYAQLPDHPDRAWARLGPALQRQGRESYEQFWHAVKDLQVVGQPQARGNAVTVAITYRTEDHRRVQETHQLGMILRNGVPLINADHLLSAQTSSNNGHGHGNGGGGDGDNGGG